MGQSPDSSYWISPEIECYQLVEDCTLLGLSLWLILILFGGTTLASFSLSTI